MFVVKTPAKTRSETCTGVLAEAQTDSEGNIATTIAKQVPGTSISVVVRDACNTPVYTNVVGSNGAISNTRVDIPVTKPTKVFSS